MKKNLLILCLIFLANLIFAQGTATISIGSVYDPVPGPITVPVTLDAISNPNGFPLPDAISGFALYFYYDASVLELDGLPFQAIVMDPAWTTTGSTVVNEIVDSPMPGYNTIAFIYATGGIVQGVAGTPIGNVSFNYLGGSTNLLWTTSESLGNSNEAKIVSYVVDYDGVDYLLTTNPGCVCLSGYDITFQVEDENGNPVQDALVTIGSESILSNASGEAVFNRPDGDYDYTITKTGYYDVTGTVTVAGADQTVPISLFPLGSQFDVTFHVTDGTNDIEGALVTVGSQSLYTNINGEVIFSLPNGNYNYNVSKYGYTSANGTFDVASASQNIDVQLTMLPHYDITFHVTSGGSNLEGATIDITDVGTMVTDINGNAVFSLIDGNYDYTITKTGYLTVEDVTTVAGASFTVEETMDPVYAVTIHVTKPDNTGLQGASVTIGTETKLTDASGNAIFNLIDGNYSYTVTKTGYNPAAGNFVVAGSPLTVEVPMTLVEYEVTFHVTSGGNNLEGVEILLDNGESSMTDINGIATFMLSNGEYVYTASKSGYGTEEDIFTVSGSVLTVNVVMTPLPTYTVTFHVTSGVNNLEGAEITIGVDVITTDVNGIATIDLLNGPYSYTVTKLGYIDQSGTFTVVNAPLSIDVDMPLFPWSITFHVTSDGADLPGALVTVEPGNITGATGTNGNAVLEITNGTYTYTVEKAGYNTETGDLIVDNENQTIEVDLGQIEWEVKFHIVSTGGGLEGVSVTCNETTEVTDSNGDAFFYLYDGTYDYLCEKTGYIPQPGSITVNGANLIKNLIMFPLYDVTFVVTTNGSPVEGATVSLEGEDDQITPANGTVVFQKDNGTYNWTVTHPNFGTVSDQVTVNNAPVTVPVMLVGVNTITSNSFSILPNPSNDGIFNLTTTSTIKYSSDIAVYDLTGKIVYAGNVKDNDVNIIDLSEQEPGMYIMQILFEDQVFNKRLVIQ